MNREQNQNELQFDLNLVRMTERNAKTEFRGAKWRTDGQRGFGFTLVVESDKTTTPRKEEGASTSEGDITDGASS